MGMGVGSLCAYVLPAVNLNLNLNFYMGFFSLSCLTKYYFLFYLIGKFSRLYCTPQVPSS